MQPFVKTITILALTTLPTSDLTPLDSNESQSTEDDIEALAKTVQHLDF